MMPTSHLFHLDLAGDRYHLRVQGGAVLVAVGVLARAVAIDDLLALVLELGATADELLERTGGGRTGSDLEVPAPLPDPEDELPAAPCPRRGRPPPGAFTARSRCHCWGTPPEPDHFDAPHRPGPGGSR